MIFIIATCSTGTCEADNRGFFMNYCCNGAHDLGYWDGSQFVYWGNTYNFRNPASYCLPGYYGCQCEFQCPTTCRENVRFPTVVPRC